MAAFSHLNLRPCQTHTIIIAPLERSVPVAIFVFKGELPMFQNPKYLTHGVQCTLPAWLVLLLWSLIDRIPDDSRDYLQVFRLQKTAASQHIAHSQEQPPYSYEMDVPCDDAVNAKIFVIDDQTHSTMLLAEEY